MTGNTWRDPVAVLLALAPQARACYRESFARPWLLERAGFVDHPLRLAHFLAQVCHETDGLRVLVEDLTYTTAERLMTVWPGRFPTPSSARPYVRNPRALANKVYGGRMGNVDPEDGWTYRGRGLLQITGRDHYARNGKALGIPLESQPYLAISPDHALAIALETWRWKGCDAAAEADDVVAVTRRINGGRIGLAGRRRWLARVKAQLEVAA
jgi:putative chitinase